MKKSTLIVATALTALALAGCAKNVESKETTGAAETTAAVEKTTKESTGEQTSENVSTENESENTETEVTIPAEMEGKEFPEYLAPVTDPENFFTRWGYPAAMIDSERYQDSYIDGDKLVIVGYDSSLESLDTNLRAALFTFYSDGHHIYGSDEIGWFVRWKGVRVGFETGTVSDNELYIRFYDYEAEKEESTKEESAKEE